MTGPEHYREAERLVNLAQNSEVFQQSATALAQVHATLALAAATALGTSEGLPAPDWEVWYRAASEGPGEKQRRDAARAAERAEFETEPQS